MIIGTNRKPNLLLLGAKKNVSCLHCKLIPYNENRIFLCLHFYPHYRDPVFNTKIYLIFPCLTLYGIAVYLWHCKYIKRNDRGMTTVIRVYSFLCVTHKENYINPLWFHCHSAVCIFSVHKCKDFTFTIIWAYKTIKAGSK